MRKYKKPKWNIKNELKRIKMNLISCKSTMNQQVQFIGAANLATNLSTNSVD